MDNVMNGVMSAVRALGKARLSSGLVIAALALGVGANSVMFSAVRGVLLAPLPYPEPDRIVQVWTHHRASPELFTLLEEQLTQVSSLDASQAVALSLEAKGEAWEIPAGQVTNAHFDLLGGRPEIGRTFTRADHAPGSEPVIVLGHGLWATRFGSDPEILGRSVRLGDASSPTRTVVGVMPQSHQPLGSTWQAWIPLTLDPRNRDAWSDNYSLGLHARLRPGASLESATGELRAVAGRLAAEHPGMFLRNHEKGLDPSVPITGIVPMREVVNGSSARRRLFTGLLVSLAALALSLGGPGIYGVVSYGVSQRRREIAVIMALGAGRRTVLGEVIRGGLRPVAFGLVTGLALAAASGRLLAGDLYKVRPYDPATFVVVSIGVMLAAVAAVIVPALRAAAFEPIEALRHR